MAEKQIEISNLSLGAIRKSLIGHKVRVEDKTPGHIRRVELLVAKVYAPTLDEVKEMGMLCYLVPPEETPTTPVWKGEIVTILDLESPE